MEFTLHNNTYQFEELITDDTDLSVLNIGMLNAQLTDLQIDKVAQSLKIHKSILPVETGLGKTYIQVGLMNSLLPLARVSGKKIMLVVPANKLIDYLDVIRANVNCQCIGSSGVSADITYLLHNWDTVEMIVTTPAAWASIIFATHIYNNRNRFIFLGYDEANGLNDDGYLHFLEVARLTKFVSLANATPVASTGTYASGGDNILLSLYNLLYGINAVNSSYAHFYNTYAKKCGFNNEKKIDNVTINTESIKRDFGSVMINANRADIGIETVFDHINFHQCIPTAVQYTALNNGVPKQNVLYCGDPANNIPFSPLAISALGTLMQILIKIDPQNKKIIYAKNTATITGLYNILSTMGYPVLILDGQTTNTEQLKHAVEVKYDKTPGAILLTTLIRGSNFGSANNVIAYDFPSDLMQYVARAARGFAQKNLSLDIIYYPEFDKDIMFGSLLQIKAICDTLDRQTQILPALLQELERVYPADNRLNELRS